MNRPVLNILTYSTTDRVREPDHFEFGKSCQNSNIPFFGNFRIENLKSLKLT